MTIPGCCCDPPPTPRLYIVEVANQPHIHTSKRSPITREGGVENRLTIGARNIQKLSMLSVNKLLIKCWLLQMLLCVWLNERKRVEGGNRMTKENVEMDTQGKLEMFSYCFVCFFFSSVNIVCFFLRAPAVNQKKNPYRY